MISISFMSIVYKYIFFKTHTFKTCVTYSNNFYGFVLQNYINRAIHFFWEMKRISHLIAIVLEISACSEDSRMVESGRGWQERTNNFKVLLMSASGALFQYFKRRNYFMKKSNISIFNVLITHIFIKI